ncbi:MAG TPA: glycosyltransferase [Blastocatellia bacterium]|jgi:GT2 family glycosyltransferase
MKASVIVPTHNRPDGLAETLDYLRRQSVASDCFEIIVVDDGSLPPVTLAESVRGPRCRLVRLNGLERSAARNRGADIAKGEVLIFVDDDTVVRPDFVASHLCAHAEWPCALVVGANRLSDAALATPFGQFRQKLERRSLPERRGPTDRPNFCTAQNMSINRDVFRKLGGFAPDIISGEDQDLALRHTSRGGRIVFLPEAMTIHHDTALDVRSYCRRAEWGAQYLIAFCRRHPDWPDNVERERVNGPARLGREPLNQTLRKSIKRAVASNAILVALFAAAALFERAAPGSRALDRVYRLLLGAHILRGYRKGLKRFGPVRGTGESLDDATPGIVALGDE